jgi:hypothetical protein
VLLAFVVAVAGALVVDVVELAVAVGAGALGTETAGTADTAALALTVAALVAIGAGGIPANITSPP